MNPIFLPRTPESAKPLPFSGKSPDGKTVEVNSRYFVLDGKPVIPISGEFQFSRYRRADWERELCKMKAGGITLIATYVFWIHHEEREGIWDFSGQRDLRAFVSLCQKLGLPVLLRIGPWCHGECRNGGFPDWLQFQNDFRLRTDDPTYLSYVRRWFGKIADEVRGLLFADGGPVIGIQIENEYRSYAEPNREKRHAHLHTLRRIAASCGLCVPIYTATAWGSAAVADMETLPVLGGYADEAWAPTTAELHENVHFLFTPPVNDQSIGSDLKCDDGNYAFDVDMNQYPYLTAEMGGGMQVTLLRRVVIDAKDTEAIVLCTLGSGAALIGYYMAHGGTNPDGVLTTLEESADAGSPNTLPVKSYDFQALLRENGDAHESFHRLRRHHYLMRYFGALLADSVTVLPEDNAAEPNDFESLRYAIRHNPALDGGFVFLNNHVRRRKLACHPALSFTLDTAHGTVKTVPIDVKDGDIRVLPYNLPLGDGVVLISSNATPLCRLGSTWFFYTDGEPIYRFAEKSARIVTLTEEESRRAYRLGNRLYVTDRDDCVLYEKDGRVTAEFYADTHITVYDENGSASEQTLTAPTPCGKCGIKADGERAIITLSYPDTDSEPMLKIEYLGDRIEVFDEKNPNKIVADWFTTGLPFKLSLAALGCPNALSVKLYPSVENRYFDLPVESGCALREVTMIFRHTAIL